jgi:hypothetical protein
MPHQTQSIAAGPAGNDFYVRATGTPSRDSSDRTNSCREKASIFTTRLLSVYLTCFKYGSNSAADFPAFDPLSQPEAEFRQSVWQSDTWNSVPKNA